MKKKLLLVSAMMLSVSSLMAQSKAVSEPRLCHQIFSKPYGSCLVT